MPTGRRRLNREYRMSFRPPRAGKQESLQLLDKAVPTTEKIPFRLGAPEKSGEDDTRKVLELKRSLEC